MVIKAIFFLLVFNHLVSCNNGNKGFEILKDCNGNLDTIYQVRDTFNYGISYVREMNFRNKLLHGSYTTYFDDGSIDECKFYINGKIFGDNELYYFNNNIKKYQFLIDSLHNTFSRSYDINKNCTGEEGRPIAYKLIGTNRNNDTSDIKFVIVDKVFSKIKVEVSEDGLIYKMINFENCDDEFPFNKVYRDIRNIKSKNIFSIYFKINCIDKYNNSALKYYDTLTLEKNRPTVIK